MPLRKAAATVDSGPAPALRPRASAAPFKLFALKGCEDLIKANPEEARTLRCADVALMHRRGGFEAVRSVRVRISRRRRCVR